MATITVVGVDQADLDQAVADAAALHVDATVVPGTPGEAKLNLVGDAGAIRSLLIQYGYTADEIDGVLGEAIRWRGRHSASIASYMRQIAKDVLDLQESNSIGTGSPLILVKLGKDEWVVHEYEGKQIPAFYSAEQDFKIMAGQQVLLVKVIKAK